MKTGIDYEDVRVELGMVSEFEEREVAVFCGYTWTEWLSIPVQERAASVAHYRLHLIVNMHAEDSVSRSIDADRLKAQRSKPNDGA